MLGLRNAIQKQVHGIIGFGSDRVGLDAPLGDPGLFGPSSVTWRVHGDFSSMMVGGISSLLLQMLHPGALAGVWDHSNFQQDMEGRLRRTAQFVSSTTYGASEAAGAMIDQVRRIHDRVYGELTDGTPYSANDPELLTWVHVAGVRSFLAAYLRYRNPLLTLSDQDRYFRENAAVAERLGAKDIPVSRREIDAYLALMRPRLRYDDRTRVVTSALLSPPVSKAALVPVRDLTMKAGIDLLPSWASDMHRFRLTKPEHQAVRVGVRGIALALRWAVRDSSYGRAKKRMGLG